MSLATTNVTVTRSGTGWTADVTPLNLDSNTNLKDFIVLVNGVSVGTADYVKTSPTLVTYTGNSLAVSTVQFRRLTPLDPVRTFDFGKAIRAGDINDEFTRVSRRAYDLALNGVGSGSNVTGLVLDAAYGVSWNGDTLNAPSRNAVYDKIAVMDTSIAANTAGIVGKVNTADLPSILAPYAPINSPTFTGVPLAPTANVTVNTTQLATTQWAYNWLASTSAVGTTRTKNTDNTQVATTGFAHLASAVKRIYHWESSTQVALNASTWVQVLTSTAFVPLSQTATLVLSINHTTSVAAGLGLRVKVNGTVVRAFQFQSIPSGAYNQVVHVIPLSGLSGNTTITVEAASSAASGHNVNWANNTLAAQSITSFSTMTLTEYDNPRG